MYNRHNTPGGTKLVSCPTCNPDSKWHGFQTFKDKHGVVHKQCRKCRESDKTKLIKVAI